MSGPLNYQTPIRSPSMKDPTRSRWAQIAACIMSAARATLQWMAKSRLRRISFELLAVVFVWWVAIYNYVSFNEVGVAWNRVTGTMWTQGPGIHFTWPWVAVSAVDTRPVRVCVTSAGKGFSCKLVRFVPSAYKEFVATEGHYYWWWANRLSFNFGYREEYRGMKDILRGYAYGSHPYAFISIDTEIASR